MKRATVTIDLDKITENTAKVTQALGGIEVVGVTKVTCGDPNVARAMIAGGASAIGESRHENASRLRDSGIAVPLWLLRAAPPAMAEETVELFDVSLASESVSLQALDRAAADAGKRHGIVAMVDIGDLREGVLPPDLPGFVLEADALAHIDVVGVGVSLTCYGGVVPDAENLERFALAARAAESALGRKLIWSAGMSSSIESVVAGQMPEGVHDLRVGESIILGVSTVTRQAILGLHTDAITVAAPVIELKTKPSIPEGTIAQDAFGEVPRFEDRGRRRRALVAIGRQDVTPKGLRPLDPGVEVLGASSDHLIVDVEEMETAPVVGDAMEFVPDYAATLRSFTSPYVTKTYRGETPR